MQLTRLFSAADVVASARILSGDAESYQTAMYKVEVIRSFKGTKAGEVLYVGPCTGFKLGGDYLLFLRKAKEAAEPRNAATAIYGIVQHVDVFNDGYSAMEASYQCVFDGKEISQQCDYGLRVCTDYIKLPKDIRTFPPKTTETPFGCRWTRRKDFESLVQQLAATSLERHSRNGSRPE